MNLPPETIVAVPMAAAIFVFFWALDKVRKERLLPATSPRPDRATPRELVDRLLKPAAENLSQRRQNQFNDQLTSMLQLLSNSLKTGYAIDRALETVAAKSQPPVSTEFERVTTEITLGTSVEDALSSLLLRINSPDLEFIVTAILLHIRVGGNLAEVLDNISDTLRDRLQTKRDMSVLTAQSRASASIITGLPILLALGLYVFVPGYYAPMTSSVVGLVMLGFAGFMVLIGNLLIQRMTSLEP